MKILIIQNKRIGDVLLASILPNNLKKIYPDSVISFFCYDYAVPVLEKNPQIDHIIAVKEKELKGLESLVKMAVFIRKEEFDIVIDPYVKLQSQLITLFSKAKSRIGYKKRTLPLAYTHKIPLLKNKVSGFGKAIDDRINLLKCLNNGIEIDPYPRLYLSPAEIQEGKEKLKTLNKNRKTLMFGVLGSDSTKSLPKNYTISIINFIIENYEVNILFNYMPSQKMIVDEILEEVKPSDKIYSHIIGENLREFIKIMNHSDLMVANEGGSVHIAKALGKPTFTIFSPYIIKDSWATFENEPQNKSLHLIDVRPDLFKNKQRKEIVAQSSELYKELTPEYILPALEKFMKENSF